MTVSGGGPVGGRHVFGAIDIGASGGRVMAGIVTDGQVELEPVHRFTNGVVERDGSLFWDVTRLFDEVLDGLTALATRYGPVVSLGIDTWAVDYALLDDAGALIGDPYAYRDDRTNGLADEVHGVIDPAELYGITGLQFLSFNTIYQIAAEQRGDRWSSARTLLLLPDLLAYWLTGVRRSEATNASTTGLFDATTQDWSSKVAERLGFDLVLLAPVEAAGTVRGGLLPEIVTRTGLTRATVVTAVGSHDTASAVVAVPATSPGFAYVSSGTWSLVGVEVDTPILTEASRVANFTNEGGVDGRIRFLRNAGGLWLLQECIRQWSADGESVELGTLLEAAAGLPLGGPLVDVGSDEFVAPGSMVDRIQAACGRAGQAIPDSPAAVTRCVLESLAAEYATVVDLAATLSGRTVDVIHVVGGGSQNALLCQLTADRCGRTVVAGPVEATALGNVLVQARTHAALSGTLEDLRALVAAQATLTTYEPS